MKEAKNKREDVIEMKDETGSIVQDSPNKHEVVRKLQNVENSVERIKKVNPIGSFFQAGKHAKDLAGTVGDLTDVVKWELNMVLFALNAQIKRKEEFDQIMQSLNEVEKELKDDVEQKEYLNKVRSAVSSMREQYSQINKLKRLLLAFGCAALVSLCVATVALILALR